VVEAEAEAEDVDAEISPVSLVERQVTLQSIVGRAVRLIRRVPMGMFAIANTAARWATRC
jgi:hypothetical protein